MKRTTRSAATLVSTTVLAGAGIAAAVTGVSGPASTAASTGSASPASSPDPALSAAVQELLARSAALHDRLDVTHQQLRVLDHRLHVERRLAERLARQPAPPRAGAAAQSSPALQGASVPGLHTTTGASASTGPSVHATTRASGSGAPQVHATTRASGAGSPGVHTSTRASAGHEHESEGEHDD